MVINQKKIRKSSDATNLVRSFGSIVEMSKATKAELSCVPGMGDKKASALHDLFHLPFKKTNS